MSTISPEELRMYIKNRCKNCKNRWFYMPDEEGSDWLCECARADTDEALNCKRFEEGECE